MKYIIFITLIILSSASSAWDPIRDLSDIDRRILKDVGKAVQNVGKEVGNSTEIYKALSICQTKCAICFDGVSCDFECVQKACLDESGVIK